MTRGTGGAIPPYPRRCARPLACSPPSSSPWLAPLLAASPPPRPLPPPRKIAVRRVARRRPRRRHARRARRCARAGCGSPTRSRPAPSAATPTDVGRWTSPVARARLRPHRADRLVAGRHAGQQSWVEVAGPRPHRRRHGCPSWDTLARWAAGDRARRAHHASTARPTTSPTSTSTPGGRPAAPSLAAAGQPAAGPAGRRPRLRAVGAMASRLPDVDGVATSDAGATRPGHVVLDVPRYSQMVHSRPLPRVGRRRPGVVLADLDVDGARLLRRAAPAGGLRLGARRPPAAVGRPRRAHDLRPRLRRHRQLAVQHGVRRGAAPAARRS